MIYTILLGILGLDIVVLVHELGHLAAAKLSGVEVEAFSLGMGKKLFFFNFKNTEYRLSILPIGGYCKMKGEEQFRKALNNSADKIPFEKGSLFSVSPIKRITTYFAGPFANLVFSAVVLSFIWFVGFSINSYSNKIILLSDYPEVFHSVDNPSDKAGLLSGDVITKIDNHPVESYSDIQDIIYRSANIPLKMNIERGNKERTVTITPALDKDTGSGRIGISPYILPVIERVKKNSPANLGGLVSGDTIIKVNNIKVNNYIDILSEIKKHPRVLKFTVKRTGKTVEKVVVPTYSENGSASLGIYFKTQQIKKRAANPVYALGKGIKETWDNFSLTAKSLTLLFSGINLNKAVSGPIRITYMVGEVASEGFRNGFKSGIISVSRFLSIISVALCFANLLPIPIFDGGLILFTVIGLIWKKPISPTVFYRYQSVGLFILLIIFFLTTFSDIKFLFTKG